MATVSELIERRKAAKRRMDDAAQEVAALDKILFARLEKFAEAVDGVDLQLAAFENKERSLEGMRANLRDAKTLFMHRSLPRGHATHLHSLSGEIPDLSSYSTATGPISALATWGNNSAFQSALDRPPMSFEREVRSILERSGRPMRTGELYRALLRAGYVVPGKRPANNLAAHLSNRREIFMSTPEGWTLRAQSLFPDSKQPTHHFLEDDEP